MREEEIAEFREFSLPIMPCLAVLWPTSFSRGLAMPGKLTALLQTDDFSPLIFVLNSFKRPLSTIL